MFAAELFFLWQQLKLCYTGWSLATVFYDFYLTGIKKTPNWQNPTIFVKILYGHFDILISQKGQVKKFPPFRVVPKLCVFHPDMVQGCLGVSVWVCWCPLTPDAAFMIWGDIKGYQGGSVFRDKSICDQMSLGVYLKA